MTSQEQDLSALRRQLRCAEHDLQSELFLINHPCGDDEADPFAALKCERLYRTVRALKLKIERLQHIHSHPHRETSPQSYGASTTLPTRFAERESRTMPRRTRDVDDAEWSLVNCARAEGPLRGLRLDPSVDVGEGSEGAGESDHFLESWTWNGRPLRLVREVKLDGEMKEIRSKVDTMDERLNALEKGGGMHGWDEATKERVKAGEMLGEQRVKAKEAARRELERQAKELKAQYQEQSAIAIQSVFRGHLGRRRMKEAREKYAERIREESATVIQCGVRRMLAKSLLHDKLEEMQLKKLSASATIIQSQYRGRVARDQLRFAKSDKEREHISATIIQAWWRGCLARLEVLSIRGEYLQHLEEVAAVMLQNAWRMYKARKELARLKKEQLLKKQEAAAIMVQAAYRGHMARKQMSRIQGQLDKVEKMAESMDWAERIETEYYAKQFMTMQQRAACRIQALVRGFRERRKYLLEQVAGSHLLRSPELSPLQELEIPDLSLVETDKENKSHVVFSGEFQLPLAREQFRKDDFLLVSISVEESRDPYQLKFRVNVVDRKPVFRRSVDSALLEKLLEPLFRRDPNKDLRSSKERQRDDSIIHWVKTGKPPKRKSLITWIIDRMWFDQRPDGEIELCLGLQSTAEALKLTQLGVPKTLDSADSASMSLRKAKTWDAGQENRPVREAFQVRYIDNSKLV